MKKYKSILLFKHENDMFTDKTGHIFSKDIVDKFIRNDYPQGKLYYGEDGNVWTEFNT